MLHNGFLSLLKELGLPCLGSNHIIPLFINIPLSGKITLLPKTDNSVCVKATILPSLSITDR